MDVFGWIWIIITHDCSCERRDNMPVPFQPEVGDISLSYGPKKTPSSIFTNFITWCIRLFTTGPGEPLSRVHHAEMMYGPKSDEPGEWLVFSEEPPKSRLMDWGNSKKIVYRLINKPDNFEELFYQFYKDTVGTPYGYRVFFLFLLDWLVSWVHMTHWFSRQLGGKTVVCSGNVAKFYKKYVHIPCSDVDWEVTEPDNIYDYCPEQPYIFKCVWDGDPEKGK